MTSNCTRIFVINFCFYAVVEKSFWKAAQFSIFVSENVYDSRFNYNEPVPLETAVSERASGRDEANIKYIR